MSDTTIEILLRIGCIGVVVHWVRKVLPLTVFLPYGNSFMCWYMVQFSPHYRSAKILFDELILKQKQCRAVVLTNKESYYAFLSCMQLDVRFQSSNEEHSINLNELLSGKKFLLPFEKFVSFHGKGKKYHKVIVYFNFENDIHLESIELVYHEEHNLYSRFLRLETKKFISDDDDDDFGPPIQPPPSPVGAHA